MALFQPSIPPNTGAIAMYVEAFPDPRGFIETASAIEKPMVALKGGATAAGAKAASSHTGAPVPLWAFGPGAERLTTITDNTDVGRALRELLDEAGRTLDESPEARASRRAEGEALADG